MPLYKLKGIALSISLLLFSSWSALASPFQDSLEKYPKNYFHSPLKIPLRIISNFGSFRDNHFHSGLDLSTGGKMGLMVLASQGGYISRIKIQSGGYGKVLYITHPNGWVSVYAHLSHFAPKIESWIRKVQYKARVFELDLHPVKNEIPVLDREWIALSGNTGNSGGPHLHFEIRDEISEDIINPLGFGLAIEDHTPPLIKELVLYEIEPGIERRKIKIGYFPVRRSKNGSYSPIHIPNLSTYHSYFLGLVSDDLSSNSNSPGNVYSIELKREGITLFSSKLLRFGFEQTRCINSFLDFEAFKFQHKKIQRSYLDPGNPLPIYFPKSNSAVLSSEKEQTMNMDYKIMDIFGNFSQLNFKLHFIKSPKPYPLPEPSPIISIPYSKPISLELNQAVLFFPSNSLFDTLILTSPSIHSGNTYILGNPNIPIKDSLLLTCSIPKNLLDKKDKIYIRKGNKSTDSWLGTDSIKTWVKEFGSYTLDLDTLKPYLQWINIKNNSIRKPGSTILVHIGDHESGLKAFNAYLDEEWILMELDGKTHTGKIEIPKDSLNKIHTLKIILSDRCGNIKEDKLNLYF